MASLRRSSTETRFDILASLPEDVALNVLRRLDYPSLARMRQVHVSSRARTLLEQGQAYEALRESVADSRRCWLTEDELCSFQWSFRFKAAAGDDWIANDPWWNNEPCRIITFGHDHRMHGHPGLAFRWRFSEPLSRPTWYQSHPGSCVRIHIFPNNYVRRDPDTWGFLLESAWTLRASFPLPPRGEAPRLEDAALPVTTSAQRFELFCYNSGVDWEDPELQQHLDRLQRWIMATEGPEHEGLSSSDQEEESSDEDQDRAAAFGPHALGTDSDSSEDGEANDHDASDGGSDDGDAFLRALVLAQLAEPADSEADSDDGEH